MLTEFLPVAPRNKSDRSKCNGVDERYLHDGVNLASITTSQSLNHLPGSMPRAWCDRFNGHSNYWRVLRGY